MAQSILQKLLAADDWDCFAPLMDRVSKWEHWPLFLEKLESLNREALYVSPVHGEGHIERALLHGAFCAMEDGLDAEDTALLLEACSYHDVGRVNDWLDDEHGHRSSLRLAELTGRTGEELVMLRAAVDAHSRKDSLLEETLRSYAPADFPRALRLAQLLKDADGLDRVRINDLKTSFLRREASRDRADFALYLYGCYQRELALTRPFAGSRVPNFNFLPVIPENEGES